MKICASTKAAKYIYKYVHKRGDRAIIRVDRDGPNVDRNEIKEFQDMRSIGTSEASWRLFQFDMCDRYVIYIYSSREVTGW